MKTSYHCVFSLNYHVVVVVKRRKKLLTEQGLSIVEQSFRDRCVAAKGELLEFGGEADHVHALISLPPSVPVSVLINAVKTNSSRKVRTADERAREAGPAFWSPSYFVASCGGAPLEKIKDYVRSQERPE